MWSCLRVFSRTISIWMALKNAPTRRRKGVVRANRAQPSVSWMHPEFDIKRDFREEWSTAQHPSNCEFGGWAVCLKFWIIQGSVALEIYFSKIAKQWQHMMTAGILSSAHPKFASSVLLASENKFVQVVLWFRCGNGDRMKLLEVTEAIWSDFRSDLSSSVMLSRLERFWLSFCLCTRVSLINFVRARQ